MFRVRAGLPAGLLAAAALALTLVLSVPAPARAATAGAVDRAGAAQLLGLLNQHRASVGLPALRSDPALTSIAEGWTRHLAASGTLSHNMALFSAESHARLGIAFLGENVAMTSGDVARANQNFINSPHHRENMENRRFVLVGLGVVRDDQNLLWVTEDFGGPRAASRPATAPRRVVQHAPARPSPRPKPAVTHRAPAPVVRPTPPAGRRVAGRLARLDRAMTRLPAGAAPASDVAWATRAADAPAPLDGPAALAAVALFLSSGSGLLARHRRPARNRRLS